MKLEDKDILVSFNVKSLFTKVPISDTLYIIKDRLQVDETIVERTLFTVT